MKRFSIMDYETGAVYYEAEAKQVGGKEVRTEELVRQASRDPGFLDAAGIGRDAVLAPGMEMLGIRRMFVKGFYEGSVPEGNLAECRKLLFPGDGYEPESIKCVGPDGGIVDTGVRVRCTACVCGLVVSTGNTHIGGFLGSDGEKMSYISKMTRKKARYGSRTCAKVFETPSKLLGWLERYKDGLSYLMANEYFSFSVEYTVPETGVNRGRGWDVGMKKVREWIETVNRADSGGKRKAEYMTKQAELVAQMEEEEMDIEAGIGADDYREEVLYRMRRFGMWTEVMAAYRKDGTVMMSEGSGIIYEPDEDAVHAVEQLREYGLHPYHVIRTETEFGPMYDVLYVTPHPSAWEECERPTARGIISSFCVSACTGSCGEFGDIVVKSVNGGLKRVG